MMNVGGWERRFVEEDLVALVEVGLTTVEVVGGDLANGKIDLCTQPYNNVSYVNNNEKTFY